MEKTTRYSKKREAILQALRGTKRHPSAESLYQELKPQHPDLSLGTVYRNLSQLRAAGEIASIGTVRGQERFDGDTRPHTHFVCNRCGAVLDLDVRVDSTLEDVVSAQYGCRVERQELKFFGLCGDCQAAG